MSTIGIFKKVDGGFEGTILTLALNAKVKITAVEKKSDNSPDFRLTSGKCDVGAAWRQEKDGKEYLSVSLDDPSFAESVKAALFEQDGGGFNLVWNRQKRS